MDDGKKHSGGGVGGRAKHGRGEGYGFKPMGNSAPDIPKDNGCYSRFFSLDAWAERNLPFLIVPKASKKEKDMGCNSLPIKNTNQPMSNAQWQEKRGRNPNNTVFLKNHHPTVKPIKLISYLITMGSRPDDIVLDPFCGTGTTCIAAGLLKRHYIGIEINPEYHKIAMARLSHNWREENK